MARIESLSILTTEEGKEYLSELYGKTIENVQKELVSFSMKNTNLSGDPTSGSVEAKRFANSKPQPYGTARAAQAGNKIKAKPVNVQIDDDKEIVEEMSEKDVKLYGVEGVLDKRGANHVLRMAAYLDEKFFAEAESVSTAVSVDSTMAIEEVLETVIQECENTKNDFVDGVPRKMINLVCSTKVYGKIRNALDKQENSNVDSSEEEFHLWHGVKTKPCVHLPAGCDFLCMADESVAQPNMADPYKAEKIPLSDDYALELFFHSGTKAVAPDLIFKGVVSA